VIGLEELQLAARNHGFPHEALRHDITPVGLHYLLIHYDIPFVDPRAWTLTLAGEVERPLELSLDELRERPAHEVVATMECAGNGRALLDPHVVSQPWLRDAVGTARWRGIRLRSLLAEVGVRDTAVEVLFTGSDRGIEGGVEQEYERSLTLEEAAGEDVILAYEMNGEPLLPQHGYPLRLVVPGWYGMTNVKWLKRITLLAAPFRGYQQSTGYRFRATAEDEGTPVERMLPRSLVVPPGIPDFLTRARTVPAGHCLLEGRAWSGRAAIDRVEVTVDGGDGWHAADLAPPSLGRWAWRRWSFAWQATAGTARLGSRAFDAAGNAQPLAPEWNLGGYANNAVQWLDVSVV
jgi:sulfane dehydrogenase subunit SoxC